MPAIEQCTTCGGSGRVAAFIPLFPQINSKACPDCKPDHRLCICCGESSPGDDCQTCEPRFEHEMRADQVGAGDYIAGLGRVLEREIRTKNVTLQGERPWRLAIARAERVVVIRGAR